MLAEADPAARGGDDERGEQRSMAHAGTGWTTKVTPAPTANWPRCATLGRAQDLLGVTLNAECRAKNGF